MPTQPTAAFDRDRMRLIDSLLDEALDLGTAERASWLAALRGRSPTLAAELDDLLASDAAADRRGFMSAPLASPFGSLLTPAPGEPAPGLRLGAYAVERPLGQGGMGSVWLARRVDGRFEGEVAVKFLNLALLGDTGRERFRREGSMLARLAHPGIARLLDAGVTAAGQPYLVLEYLKGAPIDAFADARRLGIADRVRLALQVLAAVEHAHARLIIHRDLKPSNILVVPDADGAAGTAKLLDFGIAKLLDDEGERERWGALTSDGYRALTPEFAAPEQLRGDPVTTATDVYAAGVLLYILLTGRRPLDLAGRSLAAVERIVAEVDPPRPSAAFGDGPLGSGRAERAEARGGTPERLARQLRGDLDAIVLRALHKSPARRYPSAAALAEDLQRHLDGRPVVARPDGGAYRLRKFVGRHRGAVAAAAAGASLLVGAAFRERALRERAEAESRKSRAVEEYLVSVFDVADPYGARGERGDSVTARALLDRGAARVDSALAGQPDVQGELRGVLGRVYGNLGLYRDAVPLLRRALADRRAVHGPRHPAVAEAMSRLGDMLQKQNQFAEAEPLLREALAQRRALLGPVSAATAESLDNLATLLQERGALAEAEPLFREAVDVRRAVHGPDHPEVAFALNNLALLLYLRGAYDDAEPLYRRALAVLVRRLGEDHPRTAVTLHNLAQTQSARGRFAEAEPLYRRALAAKRRTLGDLHPSVTVNLNNLGLLLATELGRPAEGEALIREALALDRRMFGERHAYVAESLRNLATVLRARGELGEAEAIYRATLVMARALYGPEHPRVATALSNVAQTLHARGDVAGAVPLYREALAQFAKLVGERHRNHAATAIHLARALRERGDAAGAERLLRATAPRVDTASVAQRAQVVALGVALGEALVDQGRGAEAVPLLERALATSRARFGDGHWRTAEARLALGRALSAAGRGGRAASLLREAEASLRRQRHAQPRLAARAREAVRGLEARGA